MQVLINGVTRELPAAQTLVELIATLRLSGKRLAIEINGEIIPRSQYAQRQVKANDQLEIVTAIGGG